MIRIENKKTYTWRAGVKYFPVDRSSPVGNPFFMKNESQRDSVCDKYEEYFHNMVEERVNKPFMEYLDKIHQAYLNDEAIVLLCWCAPKRCHAETIKKYIEKL